MTAPTRTRSRSRTPARRQAYRTRGGPSPRLVAYGSVAVIALVLGGILGAVVLGGSAPKNRNMVAVNPAGSPAAEVALPTEDNPGPIRMDGLVPSGFTTGATGAVAAGVAYAEAITKLTTQPEATVGAAARKLAAPRTNADTGIITAVNGLRTTLQAKSDTVLRGIPLGRKSGAPVGARQTVDVWIAVLSATPSGVEVAGSVVPKPTEVTFLTVSVGLVYVNGDWRIETLRVGEGPTPGLGQNAPVDAGDFAKTMQTYLPYGYLPPTEVTK